MFILGQATTLMRVLFFLYCKMSFHFQYLGVTTAFLEFEATSSEPSDSLQYYFPEPV